MSGFRRIIWDICIFWLWGSTNSSSNSPPMFTWMFIAADTKALNGRCWCCILWLAHLNLHLRYKCKCIRGVITNNLFLCCNLQVVAFNTSIRAALTFCDFSRDYIISWYRRVCTADTVTDVTCTGYLFLQYMWQQNFCKSFKNKVSTTNTMTHSNSMHQLLVGSQQLLKLVKQIPTFKESKDSLCSKDPTKCQMNPIHSLPYLLFTIHFNIIGRLSYKCPWSLCIYTYNKHLLMLFHTTKILTIKTITQIYFPWVMNT